MIDLTKYADLIKEQVAMLDTNDPNWKWSVKYLGKSKVRIRWGYLDYMEEKKNCFILEMEHEKDGAASGDWLWAKTPDNDIIECYFVYEGTERPRKIGALVPIESGIRSAIEEIGYHARNTY